MKISLSLLATLGGCLTAALPVRAQSNSPASVAHPDSPARANPRAAPRNGDDGGRGPRGPLDWEHTVTLSPDGRWFVTRSLDGRMRVWELASGKSEVELPAGVIDAVFSPDSRLLACRSDKKAGGVGGRSWQVCTAADGKPTGEPLGNAPDDKDGPETVFFSPAGTVLAGFVGAGQNVRVALWDAAGGKLLGVQNVGALYGGNVAAFSPDGKTLAAAGSGTGVALMNVPDMKLLRLLTSENRVVNAMAFSPDGRRLVVGGEELRGVKGKQDSYPTACLYEVDTGGLTELKVMANRNGRVRQAVFAEGGRTVVTATDKTAQAWSVADGKLLANLPDAGYPLAVSPDGRTLAGAQFPDLVCWDTAAWRLGLKIINARPGYGAGSLGFVPLAFTPDGTGIATLRGNSAALWELPGGRPVAERAATQTQVNY